MITGKAIDGESTNLSTHFEGQIFDNSVWRLKLKYTGKLALKLNWNQSGEHRYFTDFERGDTVGFSRFEKGEEIKVDKSSKSLSANKWYTFEISTFEGVSEVWIDGQKAVSYEDPNPFPEGKIGFESNFHWSEGGTIFYDDLSLCELSAPFTSIFETE